jgi:ATP-dependent Clp protease ATP-binding subunit ClpA
MWTRCTSCVSWSRRNQPPTISATQARSLLPSTPALTPSAQRALLDAYPVARAFGSTYIDPEHVFFALVVNQETPARLLSQGIALEVSETAVDWIAERGYEPEYGARPMRRVIQRELDDRIADLFVASDLQSGGQVAVSVDGQSLIVKARHEAMPLAA